MFRAKARRRETAGAAEIPEDEQIKVDLPVDQVTRLLRPQGNQPNTHQMSDPD